MAVPFKNDIFISYAQLNDRIPPGEEKGWVTLFYESLDYQLSQRFARPGDVKIWRDKEELGGSTFFNDEIKESIDQSCLFLALTSRGYLSEESYCQKEISWFFNKVQKEEYGLKVGNRSRLINVLLQNIRPEEWFPEMKDMPGFSFHDAKREGEIGDPLQFGSELYKKQIRALVDELYVTLLKFKTRNEVPSLDTSGHAPKSFKVFLAYTEGPLTAKRDRLAHELEQKGLEVVTNIPPPYLAAEHEKKVADELANAGLSVHLFDDWRGNRIDGEDSQTYYRKQFELGVQSGKPQLVFVPQTLELDADSDHGRFIHELETGPRSGAKYKFLRENPALITQDVLQEIDFIVKGRNASKANAAALLDFHEKDLVFEPELSQVFVKRRMKLLINPESDEPQENIHLFDELRHGLSVLIIVLGYVSDLWVSRRLNIGLQGGASSLKFCGIYAPRINGSPRIIDFRVFQVSPVKVPLFLCHTPQELERLLDKFV